MFSLCDSGLISFEKLTHSKAPNATASEMESCFTAISKGHPNPLRIKTLLLNPLSCSSNLISLYADLVSYTSWTLGWQSRKVGP